MALTSATQSPAAAQPPLAPEELYLDLMKRCLTRMLFIDQGDGDAVDSVARRRWSDPLYRVVRGIGLPLYVSLVQRGLVSEGVVRRFIAPLERTLKRHAPVDPNQRARGLDWPADAETMVGVRRLDQLQRCIVEVLGQGVPGDLIETGVWRGGAAILMRAVLKAYGDRTRTVWAADSFRGLPKPDPIRAPADAGDALWAFGELAVSVEEVRRNFSRYGMLDEQVRFLVGWFRDTLPAAPIDCLAVLRLDGDMYESTMDALQHLYPKLAVGGYVIVDDYSAIDACRAAVDTFRTIHGIADPMDREAWPAACWRRSR